MKKNEGITLIALIITIIILIILTAITISNVMNSNLFGLAKGAAENYVQAGEEEQDKIDELTSYLGSENGEEKANAPELRDGMIPIKYDNENKTWVICTKDDPEWYSYTTGDKKWANVMLSDGTYKGEAATVGTKVAENDLGSMFVWIPRYAYKILSGYGTSETGNIDVVFLNGTSDDYYDKEGKRQTAKREIDADVKEGGGYTNFVVHPAFRNGSKTNYMNGEWREEIPGFWAAKFPAGYQANTITNNDGTLSTTIVNSDDEVVYSEKYYTSYYEDERCKTNALNQNLSESGYSTQRISYPVFKPLTYFYNNISIGDAYIISQEIAKANNFYGLNASKTDSHLMKNSEWGAVAYISHSKYGENKEEPYINNYSSNITSTNLYGISGIYGEGRDLASTADIKNEKPYNEQAVGFKGSSTGNITGVYDLNGGVWEFISSYISNGDVNLETYGKIFANSQVNTEGYKTLSTEYATVYPYSVESNISYYNRKKYKEYRSSIYGYGDAILETSASEYENGDSQDSGDKSWNGDHSFYADFGGQFFVRGSEWARNSLGGLFCYATSIGMPYVHNGFRSILICK